MKISFFFVVCLSLWQITLSFDYRVDKAVNHTRLIEKTEGFSQINNVNKPLNRRSLWANKIYPVDYERQLKLGISKENNIQTDNRQLFELSEFKDELYAAAESVNFNLKEIRDDEDPNSFYISREGGNNFVISKQDMEVFMIKVIKPRQHERDHMIVITNRPEGEEFKEFAEDHFDIRMVIDISKESDEEMDAMVKTFFSDSLKEILEKLKILDTSIDEGKYALDALRNLKKLNPSLEFDAVDIAESANLVYRNQSSIITAWSNQNPEKNVKFLLSPTYYGLYNLSLLDGFQFFEINFDIHKADKVIGESKEAINKILSDEIKRAGTDKFYIEKVHAQIKKMKCDIGDLEHNAFDNHTYNFMENASPGCELNGYSIKLTLYRLDIMKTIHLRFENEFVVQEFMIGFGELFDKSLDTAFKDMITEGLDMSAIIKKNKGAPVEYETLDGLFESINKFVEGNITCQKPAKDADNFTCSFKKDAKTSFVILSVVEKEGDEGFFIVSFKDPPTMGNANLIGYAHPEIFINKFNGFDQKERVSKQVVAFFDRIAKFKK